MALDAVAHHSLASPDRGTMAVRHRVAADAPPKITARARALAPIGTAREKHRAEHGLQLQVSRAIEHEAIGPIDGGEPQRVEATAPVRPAIFSAHDDDAMIVEQSVKFG